MSASRKEDEPYTDVREWSGYVVAVGSESGSEFIRIDPDHAIDLMLAR